MINKEIVKMIEDLGYEIVELKNENTLVISKNNVDVIINLSEELIKNDLDFYNLEDNEENRKRIIISEISYKIENLIKWKAEIIGIGVDEEEINEREEEIRKYQENLDELKNQTIGLK